MSTLDTFGCVQLGGSGPLPRADKALTRSAKRSRCYGSGGNPGLSGHRCFSLSFNIFNDACPMKTEFTVWQQNLASICFNYLKMGLKVSRSTNSSFTFLELSTLETVQYWAVCSQMILSLIPPRQKQIPQSKWFDLSLYHNICDSFSDLSWVWIRSNWIQSKHDKHANLSDYFNYITYSMSIHVDMFYPFPLLWASPEMR